VPNHCDDDGGELATRKDDSEEVISERLKAFERQTLPLTDYYGSQGRLRRVDGERDTATVAQEIAAALEDGHSV